MKKKTILFILIVSSWILLSVYLYGQCAMCKATIETSAEGQKIAKKLNNAILLLLVSPYLIFGTTAYIIHKNYRGTSKNKHNYQ